MLVAELDIIDLYMQECSDINMLIITSSSGDEIPERDVTYHVDNYLFITKL